MTVPDEAAPLHSSNSDVERGARTMGNDVAPPPVRSRKSILCGQCKLWLFALVALVLIGVSYFRRDFILLVIAAWSFIVVFPLVHVLIQQVAGFDDVQEEVEYKLNGNVVKLKSREELTLIGTNLLERDHWYTVNMDSQWYQAGAFSFAFTIAKAVLNMYSIISTAIKRNPLQMKRDVPNYVGSTWVFGIEIPYFLFLITYFSFTALRMRDGRILPGRMVQLSGLLKSLGRFSALNLLEFIRIDDFIYQDRMEQLMSLLGGVIGFMAFRCKVGDIAFVAYVHIHEWASAEWLSALALLNNMVSITDMKQNMISVALKAKHYRNDRWLQAVEDHLLSTKLSKVLEQKGVKWSHMRVFRRLVTMGPDDVNRLIEDLGIEHDPYDRMAPYVRIDDRKKIPKQISNYGWNWQLTNVVGVVQLKLFHLLAEVESISRQGPANPPQQGKVVMAAQAQEEAHKRAEKERTKMEEKNKIVEEERQSEQLGYVIYVRDAEAQLRDAVAQRETLRNQLRDVEAQLRDAVAQQEALRNQSRDAEAEMTNRLIQMYEEKAKADEEKRAANEQLAELQQVLSALERSSNCP